MADLLGNTIFFIVLFLNAVRHALIGTTRPRAQSLLDGLVYGCRGLVMDMFLITWMQQMALQTRIAYQDWGTIWAIVKFVRWVLLSPFGPILGALNFVASFCEGLAHILLHEEAQFAPFEPQRIVESEAWSPFLEMQDALKGFVGGEPSLLVRGGFADRTSAPRPEEPKKWWLFQMERVRRAIADDDEVMERVRRPVQYALHS
mmetsp:Transcript_21896/g.62886  ORF Transcript_21896/g.62886 Transcript_21896/m.62886 type:complete len:203 (+) Transcript_21896:3-611(+)